MSKYQNLKQAAYDANMQLPKLGLVIFTFGNVSAADRELGVFAIKPSGIPYNVKEATVVILIIGRKVGNKLIVEGEEFHGHQDNSVQLPGDKPQDDAG